MAGCFQATSFLREQTEGVSRAIPSIATRMAVWPFISWSVIASLTSLEMAKPLRLIHSRFPISTEKVWGPTSVRKSYGYSQIVQFHCEKLLTTIKSL